MTPKSTPAVARLRAQLGLSFAYWTTGAMSLTEVTVFVLSNWFHATETPTLFTAFLLPETAVHHKKTGRSFCLFTLLKVTSLCTY